MLLLYIRSLSAHIYAETKGTNEKDHDSGFLSARGLMEEIPLETDESE
jgi:hypothetical protein